MKTGTVGKLFGIDPKTVTGWVDEFEEFFTEKARKRGTLQREYVEEDLIVLNTIRIEKTKRSEIEQIRAILASGHRETTLPPQSAMITGESAVAIYSQMRALEADLERANAEIERLKHENTEQEEKYEAKLQKLANQNDERVEKVIEQNSERIEKLIREATEWRTMYQLLEKELEKKPDE